jgi:hypothetical protein
MNRKLPLFILISLLVLMIIYLFTKNSAYKRNIAILTNDIVIITENISKIVDKKYDEYKTIDSFNERYRIDSIYLQGNELLENVESKYFKERYIDFFTQFNLEFLNMPICENRLCIATQIKMQQLYSIDYELTMQYQSHFELRAIGVYANSTDFIKKGEPLKLLISYYPAIESKYPIVTIGNDTLVHQRPYYILKNTQNIKHKKDIELKVTMQSWNREMEILPVINWNKL